MVRAKRVLLTAPTNLGSIKFHSRPKNKIPDTAAAADGFIFNLADIPVFKYGIRSNKLFDFMAAGRPVLFCCNSINNPVADAGAGPDMLPAGA